LSKRFSSSFFRSDSSRASMSSDVRPPSMSKRLSSRLSYAFDGLRVHHAASLAVVEWTNKEAMLPNDRA
jgi:hypothetical protein